MINAGLILSSITFFAFTLAQNFYHLLPFQVFLGCSWSCIYVGSLLYLMRSNVEKATCTGMLDSVTSLATVAGALIGGLISELFGFKATMYTAATLAAIGFCLFRTSVDRASMSDDALS